MCEFDLTKGIEVCIDTDFVGSCTLADSLDIKSALSRMGHVVKVKNCPMCWIGKMQIEVALSTTEAKHVAISQSTRDLIPIQKLVQYLNAFIKVNNKHMNKHSALFEDKAGTFQLEAELKYRPRTKNMCAKYYHVRHHVKKNVMPIRTIEMDYQHVHVFTKPLALDKFRKIRQLIMGW